MSIFLCSRVASYHVLCFVNNNIIPHTSCYPMHLNPQGSATSQQQHGSTINSETNNNNSIAGFIYLGEGKPRDVKSISSSSSSNQHIVPPSSSRNRFIQNGPYARIDSAAHCKDKCVSSSPPNHFLNGFSFNEKMNSCYCWTTTTEEMSAAAAREDKGISVDWSTKDTFGKTYYQVSN